MPFIGNAKKLSSEMKLERHLARVQARKRIRLRWLIPPKYRDHQMTRRSTWLESFFDLAFASALSVVAIALSGHLTYAGAEQYLIVFFPILWCWVGETMYSTRFDTDDLVQRLLVLVEIGAVAGMAIYAPRAFTMSSTATGFALSYAICRLVLVFKYLVVSYFDRAVRPYSLFYAAGFGVASLLWIVSVFTPAQFIVPIRLAAIICDLATPNLTSQFSIKYPPHMSHAPERFGLFTLVLIGEMVAAAISASLHVNLTFYRFYYITLVLWLAFSVWWDYFEAADGAGERVFSSKQDLKAFRLWMYCHLPLAASLVAFIAVIYSIIGMNLTAPIGFLAASFISVCCFILNATLILIWYSKSGQFGKTKILSENHLYLYWFHALLYILVSPLLARSTPVSALAILSLIALAKVVMEVLHIASSGSKDNASG